MINRKFNISVSLELKHLEYLDKKYPNASEAIRKMIDKEIKDE